VELWPRLRGCGARKKTSDEASKGRFVTVMSLLGRAERNPTVLRPDGRYHAAPEKSKTPLKSLGIEKTVAVAARIFVGFRSALPNLRYLLTGILEGKGATQVPVRESHSPQRYPKRAAASSHRARPAARQKVGSGAPRSEGGAASARS
jgi:hypothetical protein